MNSFIGWIGGKRALRNAIVEQFPEKFGRYIEVFGGAGWVLFSKDKHAEMEVFNDKNGDLINLFRCVKHHAPEMQRLLSMEVNARETFNEYLFLHRNNPFLTDLQRAVQYFILIKTSYGCSIDSYGCRPKSFENAIKFFPKVQQRLDKVIIENKDFADLIKTYDRPDALFYCDPPYYSTEDMYDVGFGWSDHVRLRDTLTSIQGKFLLSYNDCLEIRGLYKGLPIFDFSRTHSMAQRYKAGKEFEELLIGNYDLYERERDKPRQMTMFGLTEDLSDTPDSFDYEKILKGEIASRKTRK